MHFPPCRNSTRFYMTTVLWSWTMMNLNAICLIPKRKRANFRDLTGVLVNDGKAQHWETKGGIIRKISSARLCHKFHSRNFHNVVTWAEPHNQIILHPKQDRVLTIRENARASRVPWLLQAIWSYKKKKDIQIGNAVAVPVARSLGYALGLSFGGSAGSHPQVWQNHCFLFSLVFHVTVTLLQ